MSQFKFYYPIDVRYGDLDPQGHVNNAKYFTYIEQARIAYIRHLDLWDGGSFKDIGIILADVQLTYKAPILWAQKIEVGVGINRLGKKSFDFKYSVIDSETKFVHATAKTVQVSYDYATAQTIPIPTHWRRTITLFENL